MAGSRPILSFISIVMLAGGILLDFFVILSGATRGTPEGKIYFLQASTDGILDKANLLRNPARWTYFALCGVKNGHNAACHSVTAALPFDPVHNFGTRVGVPHRFLHDETYYYLSRVSWAFYLIALFFAVVALFLGLLALCTRIGAFLSSLTTLLAFFSQAVAASLMTAWTVLARNAWHRAGNAAKLGVYAYGFTWGALGCFLVAAVLFCIGGVASGDRSNSVKRNRSTRSTRSRGSFIDGDPQHRVKDDYE